MVVGGFKSSPAPPDNPSNLVTRQHCTLYFCLQACPPYGNSYRKYVVTVTIRRATRVADVSVRTELAFFHLSS